MRTSQKGIDLIQKFEGLFLKSYRCPAGVLTIGYGHTTAEGYPAVNENMTITVSEANDILRRDLGKEEATVSDLVKVPLNQNQFDALVSFVFNVGRTNFANSTLLKKLNAGQYDAVPTELMKWTRGGGKQLPGLVRRRQAEGALWQQSDKSEFTQETRLTPDAPQPAKNMLQSKEGNAAIAAGGAGATALATQILPEIQNNADLLETVVRVFGKPVSLALIVVVIACVGIWFWRRQRLQKEATDV
jgi:GH24 family phage-related lysozyme (muramidase)